MGKFFSFFTILLTFFAVRLWNNKMKTIMEILELRDNSPLYNNIMQKIFQSFRFNDKMDKMPSGNKKSTYFFQISAVSTGVCACMDATLLDITSKLEGYNQSLHHNMLRVVNSGINVNSSYQGHSTTVFS